MMDTSEANQDQKNIFKVMRVVPESPDINSLYLEGSMDGFAARKAGQYVSIRIMRPEGWTEPHPFTISGAPEDPFLRLTIKMLGKFTSAIPELKPGTPVKCMGPLGVFCKGIDEKPSITMIAGGVGITPFMSVFRHFRNVKASNSVTLFWAIKSREDVICLDEIKAMSSELNLSVVLALSRDEDAARHYDPGYPRILFTNGHICEEIFRRHEINLDSAYYLCGPPPMMEAVLADLQKLGIDPDAVERERFSWK